MAFRKTINAKVLTGGTLNKLRKLFPKIHVDKHQLQRLLSEWDDQTKAEHMRACFEGHSNIYTIVLISINGCLDYCNDIISDYDKEDSEYEAVQETIDYLSDLKSKGKEYLNIDGQHRVKTYKDFLKSKFTLDKNVIDYISYSGSNKPIAFDMKGVKFTDMPDETKKAVLDTPLTLVVIDKATLQDMVDVTIYTNIGEPWNNHERRIIIPSKFNRFLMSFMNDNPLLEAMFSNTKNLSGSYSLLKKGDSLIIAEWIAYHYNVMKKEIYNWPKETQLDLQSSVAGLKAQSSSKLNKSKQIVQMAIDMANTISTVKYERTGLDNLFILLTILQNSKHPLNSFGKKVKINGMAKFMDWFLKMEARLREEDFYIKDSKGKIVVEPITGKKMTNSESFKRKCGAKKTDDIQLRSNKMINEFVKSYDDLFSSGIVTLIDTTNYKKKDKLQSAIENDWADASGEEFTFEELMGSNSTIEGDHQEARDSGNDTSKSNLVLRKKRANIRKSNKQIIN